MPNGIWDRDTYVTAEEETQRKMTFDMLKAIHDKQPLCEIRFKKLEARKWRDKGIATGSGLFGGFIAVFFKKMFLP